MVDKEIYDFFNNEYISQQIYIYFTNILNIIKSLDDIWPHYYKGKVLNNLINGGVGGVFEKIYTNYEIIINNIANSSLNCCYYKLIDIIKKLKTWYSDELSSYNYIFNSNYYNTSFNFYLNIQDIEGNTIKKTITTLHDNINKNGRLFIKLDNNYDNIIILGDLHGDIFPLLSVLRDKLDNLDQYTLILLGDVFDPYNGNETFSSEIFKDKKKTKDIIKKHINLLNIVMLYFLCYLIFICKVKIFWIIGNHDLGQSLFTYIGLFFYYLPNIFINLYNFTTDQYGRNYPLGQRDSCFFVSSDIIIYQRDFFNNTIFLSHSNNYNYKPNSDIFHILNKTSIIKKVPEHTRSNGIDKSVNNWDTVYNKYQNMAINSNSLNIYGHTNNFDMISFLINEQQNITIIDYSTTETINDILNIGYLTFIKTMYTDSLTLDFTYSLFKKPKLDCEIPCCELFNYDNHGNLFTVPLGETRVQFISPFINNAGKKENACKQKLFQKLEIPYIYNEYIENTGHIVYINGIYFNDINRSKTIKFCAEKLSLIHVINFYIMKKLNEKNKLNTYPVNTLQTGGYKNIKNNKIGGKNINDSNIDDILKTFGSYSFNNIYSLIETFVRQLFLSSDALDKYNIFYNYYDESKLKFNRSNIILFLYPFNMFDFKKYNDEVIKKYKKNDEESEENIDFENNINFFINLNNILKHDDIEIKKSNIYDNNSNNHLIVKLYEEFLKFVYNCTIPSFDIKDTTYNFVKLASLCYIEYSYEIIKNNKQITIREFLSEYCVKVNEYIEKFNDETKDKTKLIITGYNPNLNSLLNCKFLVQEKIEKDLSSIQRALLNNIENIQSLINIDIEEKNPNNYHKI